MKRSSAVLGILLGVSLLLNVVAFRRGAPELSTSPRAAEKRGGAPEGLAPNPEASAVSLKAELERERKLVVELREAIRRLEADREVLGQAATAGAAAAKSPTAGLREKLRKMKKLFKASEDGVQPDQEAMLEMSGEIMEVMKLGLARTKDPKSYAEFLQVGTEIALEDEAALAPDQAAAVSRIFQELAEGLGRIEASNGGDRLIRELELEGAALERVPSVLTPAQQDVLRKATLDDLPSMATTMNTTWLQKANAADTIVKTWTQAYQLQESQLPAARAAAESFLRALEGVDKGLLPAAPTADSNWRLQSYEKRITVLRAQMTAFRGVEGSLTAAQLERFRVQAPREFRLADFAAAVEPPK